jgi:hypothetical protein
MELRRYGCKVSLDMSSIQLKFEPAMLEDELGGVNKCFPSNNPVTMGFDCLCRDGGTMKQFEVFSD